MHLKTAMNNIRRSPFQALAAIFVLSVTFFIATIISTLIYSSSQLLTYFETRPQVIAFIKSDADSSAVDALKRKLMSDARVKDVKFVSKEDALTIYKSATADNPLLGELVSPSIFPASLEFSIKDLGNAQQIIDEVEKEGVIENVEFTAALGNKTNMKDAIGRLTRIAFYIRVGGIALAVILGVTSFLVLMIVIGMRITTRRGEIETLQLIGASKSFVSFPLTLEAIIYSTLGVTVGWVLALILILYATPTILGYFGGITILPHDTLSFFKLFLIILGGEVMAGIIIAVIGSSIATGRGLSRK